MTLHDKDKFLELSPAWFTHISWINSRKIPSLIRAFDVSNKIGSILKKKPRVYKIPWVGGRDRTLVLVKAYRTVSERLNASLSWLSLMCVKPSIISDHFSHLNGQQVATISFERWVPNYSVSDLKQKNKIDNQKLWLNHFQTITIAWYPASDDGTMHSRYRYFLCDFQT